MMMYYGGVYFVQKNKMNFVIFKPEEIPTVYNWGRCTDMNGYYYVDVVTDGTLPPIVIARVTLQKKFGIVIPMNVIVTYENNA